MDVSIRVGTYILFLKSKYNETHPRWIEYLYGFHASSLATPTLRKLRLPTTFAIPAAHSAARH